MDADSIEDHALAFITVDEDDHFEVNPEAVAYLRGLNGRVAIVSIAGLYRTGKSYLLNSLTGNNGAFGVGPTVKPCTKGVWLWGKALPAVDGSGEVHVLFMDTEGLGSTVRSETYDCRIFALALLLSSIFVYNSVGVIDGNAVSKLSLVVNLTKHIHVKAQPAGKEDNGTDFASFFPSFMWVVRDFGVRLEKDGRRITSREYLEDALKPEDGLSDAAEAKNAVRQLIRNFFPERDCVTLVRPVNDEKALASLPTTPLDSPVIRPEFRTQLEALRRKLLGTPRPKTLYGRPLSGSMLASLAVAYVQALNTTGTPTISTAWDRVVEGQCGEAVEAGVGVYSARMRELMAQASTETARKVAAAAARSQMGHTGKDKEVLIVELDDLLMAHGQASADALRKFASSAVQDPDKTPPYETRLRETLEQAFAAFRRSNDAASATYCSELLDALNGDAAKQLSTAMQGQGAQGTPLKGKSKRNDSFDGRFAEPESDDATDAALQKRAAEAASAVITATAVSRSYKTVCASLQDSFTISARGPASERILADFCLNRLPNLLADAAGRSDDSVCAHVVAVQSRMHGLSASLASARGRDKASSELAAQERRSAESALAEASRQAGETAEKLRATVAARDAELKRGNDKFERLVAAFESNSIRADEEKGKLLDEVTSFRGRLDAVQSERLALALDAATAAALLAESREGQLRSERESAATAAALASADSRAAVLLERVRGSENETVRLREETELLYESNKVTKDLLAAKVGENEELEFQWGQAKARLAQADSEKGELAAELSVLEGLAAKAKACVVKAKLTGKLESLDKMEQRRWDLL